MQASGTPAFDPRELRRVLGSFVTGVTVITTLDAQGKPHGLTANSFSSVSLDPPLILWSQSLNAPSHPVFREAERFAINILSDDQVEVSNRFARGGQDKFAGLQTRTGLGGVPLIPGCAAYLECRRVNSFPGGDHMIFLGEVERIERNERQPLVFGGGRYLVAQPHDLGPLPQPSGTGVARLQAVRMATRAVADLSDELDETLGLGVWGNKGPTIVRWEESKAPVSDNLRTGVVLPMLTSATGLAFAAWLPRELTAELMELELAANLAAGDGQRVEAALAQIRQAGIVRLEGTDAFTDWYGGRINALSVPVFGPDGTMVLALTAIGSAQAMDIRDEGRLVTGLRRCAADLATRIAAAQAALATP